jgi:hypothetical protein
LSATAGTAWGRDYDTAVAGQAATAASAGRARRAQAPDAREAAATATAVAATTTAIAEQTTATATAARKELTGDTRPAGPAGRIVSREADAGQCHSGSGIDEDRAAGAEPAATTAATPRRSAATAPPSACVLLIARLLIATVPESTKNPCVAPPPSNALPLPLIVPLSDLNPRL